MLEHLNEAPEAPARVVVVGAGGFVGGAVAAAAERRGIAVLALARADLDLMADGAGERLAGFLCADDALVAAAAMAPCRSPSMLRDNVLIAEALADALRRRPVAHVLNIGSDAIYADGPLPLSEASSTAPGSLHGIMHLAREVMLREAAGDTPFATLRPSLIYGAADPHNGYGPNRFRRLAADGKPIVLFGEGEERRDHVLIDDVTELALRILLHRSRGVLNASTGTVISFRDAAELVVGLFPERVPIEGSPRTGPMPHGGYRPFDASATRAAFPDFHYTLPAAGFARVHRQSTESA